jgi:hypothetical protein
METDGPGSSQHVPDNAWRLTRDKATAGETIAQEDRGGVCVRVSEMDVDNRTDVFMPH